jgi:signal transduction histidine kinase
VRSSMSISINAFGELWGLISCHAYGTRGTRVSFPIRKMCRLVGDSASRNIERLSYASRLQARKIINTAGNSKNPSGYIIASSDDLLKLFDADFGLLSIYDETKILGKLEGVQEALALLEYLRVRKFTSVMTSQDIRMDFPDLRYTPGFATIAGLLIVPLSGAGNDFIVFFRKGQLREVKWAGNPYEKYIKEGTEGYLEPRKSFKSWTENVVGKARDWTEEEVETAAVLCLVYGKFIEVWRQKEAALQNTQLTKLLLANSAHEVRTPLNAIINYLEIALEGSLDQETRENLAKSHSASKSLIYVINDLLDLTKTESSEKLISHETFDLKATYNDAVQTFAPDAKRKNITFEVTESPDMPSTVIGDQRRVRQAISNIVANAVQATEQGGVKIDSYVIQRSERRVEIEMVVEDTGRGMSSATLDNLFAELEQAQSENQTMVDEVITGDRKTLDHQENKKVLGLGLAVVARIVRNMQGQLRLKSEEGKGSRFVIQFPFDLPESEYHSAAAPDSSSGTSGVTQATSVTEVPSPHLAPEGEVTLIDKATPRRNSNGGYDSPRGALSRRGSSDSIGSHHSQGTMQSGRSIGSAHSGRSDADRLIEAMQEQPMRIQSPDVASSSRSRQGRLSLGSSSRGSIVRGHSPSPAPRTGSMTSKVQPPHMRSAKPTSHGQQPLQDQAMPLSALKMPTDLDEPAVAQDLGSNSATVEKQADFPKLKDMEDPPKPNGEKMRVLIAEDDPINSRIIQKRLERMGHQPYLTTNGEECASIYGEKPGHFDCVLMDMQVCIIGYSLLYYANTTVLDADRGWSHINEDDSLI